VYIFDVCGTEYQFYIVQNNHCQYLPEIITKINEVKVFAPFHTKMGYFRDVLSMVLKKVNLKAC